MFQLVEGRNYMEFQIAEVYYFSFKYSPNYCFVNCKLFTLFIVSLNKLLLYNNL